MKAPLLALCLVLSCSTVAMADGEAGGNCPPGQVEKAFHDGAAVSYQCLEAGSPMVDDTNIQYGGEGAENTTGGADPPEEQP